MDHFPYIIANERKKAKLTQESFAARLGITPQAVSKWENGIGYPDITLFPAIAQVLNIPIARLFGQSNETSVPPAFPKKYNGLPLILSHERYVCYASKTPDGGLGEDGILRFTDGSTANWNNQIVTNVGPGEIRLFRAEEILPEVEIFSSSDTTLEQDLSPFDALSLSVSLPCEVQILPSSENIFRLSASGDPCFISAIHAEPSDRKLSVEVQRSADNRNFRGQNRLTVTVGFSVGEALELYINGSSDCLIQPDFRHITVKINGSGDVKGKNSEELNILINGSGDTAFESASRSANITINGSGDVALSQGCNTEIYINGSGDVQLNQVSGDLTASIRGSGDIQCPRGELSKLVVGIMGSGDFLAEGLTAQEADLRIESAGHIAIGRIIGASREFLSKNAELHVGRRG